MDHIRGTYPPKTCSEKAFLRRKSLHQLCEVFFGCESEYDSARHTHTQIHAADKEKENVSWGRHGSDHHLSGTLDPIEEQHKHREE